jgi:RHS repeat-associated protein
MSTAVRTYSRGGKLIAMRDVQGGQSRYYHQDHQGTTQCLTDGAGNVTDRFASDAWGVPVKRTGNSTNRQWYVGTRGYELGRVATYVRQRHLDAGTARWLSADSLEARFNAYGYVDDSPALYSDPSGLVPLGTHQWRPGRFHYYRPPLRDWPNINRNGVCDAKTRDVCNRVVGGLSALAGWFEAPLFKQQIDNYRTNLGDPITYGPSILQRLLAASADDARVCSDAVAKAARYAETHLFPPGKCNEDVWGAQRWWNLYYDGEHLIGGNTPKVWPYEDWDLYWSLGHHHVWTFAKARCNCYGLPIGGGHQPSERFEMIFTYHLTDVALFDGNKIINPYFCHEHQCMRDFQI